MSKTLSAKPRRPLPFRLPLALAVVLVWPPIVMRDPHYPNPRARHPPRQPQQSRQRPYTGVYWSEELETQYTFFLRDGALFARHAHHGEFALVPTIRD